MPRQKRSRADDAETEFSAGRCLADGADTKPDGWCDRGVGYAFAVRTSSGAVLEVLPPHVCPHCRARLAWDGGCVACQGRVDGVPTIPGDRYELGSGPHWVFVASGPRAVESDAGARAAFAAISQALQQQRNAGSLP